MNWMDGISFGLLIVVWIFVMWRMGILKKGNFFAFYKHQAEQTEQLRLQTALLERIANAIEKGKSPPG